MVQLRYNYRAYPTAAHRTALAKAFGCARVVYNDGLRLRQEAHRAGLPFVPDAAVQRRFVTEARRTAERAWLAEVSSVVLDQACNDLHRAYRNFSRAWPGGGGAGAPARPGSAPSAGRRRCG